MPNYSALGKKYHDLDVKTGKRSLYVELESLNDLLSESCDMQNRSKFFLILLFTVTLAVGALTWHGSDDNEAVEQFRSLFSTRTVYQLTHSMLSSLDQSSLVFLIDQRSVTAVRHSS